MRSGHHAVANWLYSQLGGHVVFLNSVVGSEWDRLAPLYTDGFKKRIFAYSHMNQTASGCIWNCPVVAKNIDIAIDHLILTVEEQPTLGFQITDMHKQFEIGFATKIRNILVLRDAYNWTASRLARTYTSMLPKSVWMECWKRYAREFTRETNMLDDPILVSFNQWFSDEDYRRTLAHQLEIEFTDLGLQEVTIYGGGSSFDGFDYKHDGQQMSVLYRYEDFLGDVEYLRLVMDPEVARLNRLIFSFTPVRWLL